MTPRQTAFVGALFQSETIQAAAESIGISTRTARRWLQLPAIRAAILEAEADALAETTRGLLRLSREAVNTLGDTMTDQDAAAGARIRAADVVLARLLQLREAVGIEDRLAELERLLGGTQ